MTGNYWDYPTATDAVPFSDQPPGNDPPTKSNTASFFKDDQTANGYDDGYAVTGSPAFENNQNYLTDVGAYTDSASPYGAFNQAGNVFEWNETLLSGSIGTFLGYRGGAWFGLSDLFKASNSDVSQPTFEDSLRGFRVASTIPEPTAVALAILPCGILLCWKMDHRRQSGKSRAA